MTAKSLEGRFGSIPVKNHQIDYNPTKKMVTTVRFELTLFRTSVYLLKLAP
jgi:hypothetical protein